MMFDIFVSITCILLILLIIVLLFVFDDLAFDKHFAKKLREKLGITK